MFLTHLRDAFIYLESSNSLQLSSGFNTAFTSYSKQLYSIYEFSNIYFGILNTF